MATQGTFREAIRICGIVIPLVLLSPQGQAFTPEPVQAPAAQGSAPAQTGQLNGAGIPQTKQAVPFSQPSGAEVKIPGIGSIGTLPKLDFGLELLYGPQNTPDALQLDQHGQDGDVQIKGTLSHKF